MEFIKKKGLIILQLVLILGSSFLLYSKLGDGQFIDEWQKIGFDLAWWQWALVFLLSTLNWLFDTRTWQLILSPFAKIEFLKALKINIIAQSAGSITPLAVGDYGLRSYILRDQIEGRQNALLSLAYRLIKMAIRLISGLLCIVYVSWQQHIFLLGAALALVLMVLSGTTIRGAINYISKSRQAHKILDQRKRLNFTELNLKRVLIPTVLLFAAYSLQTSVLVYWLAGQQTFVEVWVWVIITYSITSFLPATGIFDPMIKSAFGALFAVQLAASPAVILLAFTVTWLMNLGVPGFISSMLFRRLIGKAYRTSKETKKPS